MAEDKEQTLPFLEVICKSSGKIRRFSVGTEAGFAVNLTNKKLLNDAVCGNVLLASHIEAVKQGEEEEPVSFGPNSLLVDYGTDWKLQTAIESYGDRGVPTGTRRVRKTSAEGIDDPHYMRGKQSPLTLVYMGKILVAFLMIFVFGAVFTLALENLPRLILYINSSL